MTAERIKLVIAALLAVGGLAAFYWLGEQALVVRLGALLGSWAAAVVVMWFTEAGRAFLAFARESWEEAKRVVWPSRKETMQTTLVVFAFVFIMAIFLWMVDASLLWLTHRIVGQGG
jgi:preprotein translocase subunit SecE